MSVVRVPVKVACVQAEPVILDQRRTLDKLESLAAEAAAAGAELVVFPETFVPAYPSSSWAKYLAGWTDPKAKAALPCSRASPWRPGAGGDRLRRSPGRWSGSSTGVDEIERDRPGTIYNTLLYYSPAGELALKHRKLIPTNHERLVWGQGDGGGLRAIQTPLGASAASSAGRTTCRSPLRALESGSRSSRLDGGRRRSLAADARPHRPRVALLRDLRVPLPARDELPGRLPAEGGDRGPGLPRTRRQRHPRPDGSYLAGPLWEEEGILYATSIRRSSSRSASASTRSGTTTAPTSSALGSGARELIDDLDRRPARAGEHDAGGDHDATGDLEQAERLREHEHREDRARNGCRFA